MFTHSKLTPLALRVLFGLTLTLGLLTGAHLSRSDNEAKWRDRIPTCQEDAVMIGHGDFHAGRWTHYQCGASVDDYQAGEGTIGQPLGNRLQSVAGPAYEVIFDPHTGYYTAEPLP